MGTVRDTRTKAPLSGVTIDASDSVSARTTVTGADGGFRFDHLAPDTYRLKYSLPGYLSSDAVGSELVSVGAGAVKQRVTLELFPLARLEGTVLDEEGRPFPGVMVYADNSLRATTNQDGRYAMEHMSPGAYRIAYRTPYEIRRRTLKRDPKTGEAFGYANTEYYPGTADPQAATPVAVSGGLDLHGFDARLRRVRLVEIGGHAVERAGAEPLAGAHLELRPVGSTSNIFLSDATFKRIVADDGSFRFDLIQPGSYTLLVYRGAGGKELPYALHVEAGNSGIDDLKIAVPPFPTIAGSVVAPTGGQWSGQVMVNLRSAVPGVGSPGFFVTAEKFTIDDLPPGRWMVMAESDAKLPDGEKLFVKSVRFGTQNALGETLTVAESGNPPLEIQLSPGAGRVAGTVADENGLPRKDAVILIFRATEKSAFGRAPATASSKDDGSFVIDGLAPGSYRLLVVSGEPGAGLRNAAGWHSVYLADAVVSGERAPAVSDSVLVEVKAGETAVVRMTSPKP